MGMQTIVVGVDFTPAAEIAVKQALAVARRQGARLVLAHAAALPDAPSGVPESMRSTAEAYLQVLRGRAGEDQEALAALADRFGGQGAEISQVLVDGFADDALLDAATKLSADLLVTGSHGRRGLGRLLLGSVSERVVRRADVPVLVARGDAAAADLGFRRILVATDFSDAAERGLQLALDLAAEGATLDLVHFWQVPGLPRGHASDEVDATVEEIRLGMIQHGTERGARALADHPEATVRFHLREGDAQDGIEDWATAEGCDLIVVGSHGHRGLRRLLLGSVAESTVRHATCSVLVARVAPVREDQPVPGDPT